MNATVEHYRRAFESLADRPDHDRRSRAMIRLAESEFTVRGREDWKYGDIRPLAGAFTPMTARPVAGPAARALIDMPAGRHLVFLDGAYQSALSEIGDLPNGVRIRPLTDGSAPAELGRLSDEGDGIFAALNGAFRNDGLHVELDADAVLDEPISIWHLSDAAADGGLIAPRVLVSAGPGSRATIIEHHVGPDDASSLLSVPVAELDLAPGADLTHLKILREGAKALHAGSTWVKQDSGSRYVSREILLGGASARRELHVELAASGASCDLNALYLGDGDRRLDLRTRVRHAAPGCGTRELYKGLLDGRSRAVFDGQITVDRDAQETEAFQTNRNLLLSDDAVASSIPRLEIYADDVKCSHGATTGRISEEELFYLRARGLDAAAARTLLAGAFAGEVLEDIRPAALRDALRGIVAGRIDGSPA